MAISRGASRRPSKDGTKKAVARVEEPIDESVPHELVETNTTRIDEEKIDKHDQRGDNWETDDGVAGIEHRVTRAAVSAATQSHTKEIGNGLTALIPGYVAPLSLDTSSLDPYKGTLKELTRRAEQTDMSTKRFTLHKSSSSTTTTNFLPSAYAAYSFKLGKKKAPDLSAGKGWFSMMSCEITDQVKTDMQVIRNRTYLNPKTFYKKADKFGAHIQVGTVIEGSAEFFSSRLTNKERRSNLTQEIMADPDAASYVKRKFTAIQHERQAVAEHFQKHKRKVMKKGRRGL